jgi:hypothetical protein
MILATMAFPSLGDAGMMLLIAAVLTDRRTLKPCCTTSSGRFDSQGCVRQSREAYHRQVCQSVEIFAVSCRNIQTSQAAAARMPPVVT